MQRVSLVLACLLGVSSTSMASEDPSAMSIDEAAIRATVDDYVAAVNAGDWRRYAEFFVDDSIIMAPDRKTILGRDELILYARPLVEQFQFAETVVLQHVRVTGDWAALA